ncbi:hypothetical protein XH90_15275 [Bradyrhizobium sp. CCBAU 53338]|nr:hypothetical protein XH90_15275 [Bradyrhizobium sp. CCBAU 53338]
MEAIAKQLTKHDYLAEYMGREVSDLPMPASLWMKLLRLLGDRVARRLSEIPAHWAARRDVEESDIFAGSYSTSLCLTLADFVLKEPKTLRVLVEWLSCRTYSSRRERRMISTLFGR